MLNLKKSKHLEIYLIIQESDMSTKSQYTPKLTKMALLLNFENKAKRQKVLDIQASNSFKIKICRYFLKHF